LRAWDAALLWRAAAAMHCHAQSHQPTPRCFDTLQLRILSAAAPVTPPNCQCESILKLHMKTDHPSRGIWGRATWRFRPESMRKGETSDSDREVSEEKRRGDKQADCPDGRACSLRRLIFHSNGTAIAQPESIN